MPTAPSARRSHFGHDFDKLQKLRAGAAKAGPGESIKNRVDQIRIRNGRTVGYASNEEARVHHTARRRGGMAVRGARRSRRISCGPSGSWAGARLRPRSNGSPHLCSDEHGWIEGRTVAIEYRFAKGRAERYAEIAAEFVGLKVDVIVTAGAAAFAVNQATSVIPIIFM